MATQNRIASCRNVTNLNAHLYGGKTRKVKCHLPLLPSWFFWRISFYPPVVPPEHSLRCMLAVISIQNMERRLLCCLDPNVTLACWTCDVDSMFRRNIRWVDKYPYKHLSSVGATGARPSGANGKASLLAIHVSLCSVSACCRKLNMLVFY